MVRYFSLTYPTRYAIALKTKEDIIKDKEMKQEYDLSTMNSRPNPFAKQLKQQVIPNPVTIEPF